MWYSQVGVIRKESPLIKWISDPCKILSGFRERDMMALKMSINVLKREYYYRAHREV